MRYQASGHLVIESLEKQSEAFARSTTRSPDDSMD